MVLNYDCVRDILLTLEEHLTLDDDLQYQDISLNELSGLLPDYSLADIAYASKMLTEADYIDTAIIDADGQIITIHYFSLTFEGHKYLDTIRSPQLWSDIKTSFKDKAISLSFDLITAFGTALIKSRLFS